MIVMVTGSREWNERVPIESALKRIEEKEEGVHTLLSGGATGADALAEKIASERGWFVMVLKAQWVKNGKLDRGAGPKRNQKMIDQGPDMIIGFPLPRSVGTWDAIKRGVKAGIRTLWFDVTTRRWKVANH